MYRIPFAKPSISLDAEDIYHISKITKSGQFCLGKWTEELENYFVKSTGVSYAIACANATSGLTIAFKACGFRNKRVAIPAFTWPSIKLALEYNSNWISYCDIDRATWLMKPIPETSLSELVDVVSPVDIFGNQSEINTTLPVIIDAAHSYNLPNLGKRGLVEVISFSFTKPVTGGQGGMILTNDKDVYLKAKELVKLSAKITEISAYLILKEIEMYAMYRSNIKATIINLYRKLITKSYTEQKIEIATNNSTYSILFESTEVRNKVAEAFKKNGVEIKIYYTPLIKGLKNTDNIYSRIISLPVYEEIIPHINEICKLINEA